MCANIFNIKCGYFTLFNNEGCNHGNVMVFYQYYM